MCQASLLRRFTCRRPVWRCADQVRIRFASSWLSTLDCFSWSRSCRSFALTAHCPSHIPTDRRATARSSIKLVPLPDPGSSPSSSAWPMPTAPSCWPVRWQPAWAVCASACAPATILQAGLFVSPIGQPPLPRRLAGAECHAAPSSRFDPASVSRP